jgi:hypothetical protein
MQARIFGKGDRVVVISSNATRNIRPGVYTIVQLLPFSDQGFEYRAKSPLELHDRVLAEHMLKPEKSK